MSQRAELGSLQDKYQKIDAEWAPVDMTVATIDIERLTKLVCDARAGMTALHEAIDIAAVLGYKNLPRIFADYLPPGSEPSQVGE